MKSINKRGFTLIELLAVIVILAILILLALPQVLKIMDNARRNALKTEGVSILNMAETQYAADLTTNTGIAYCAHYTGTQNDLKGYVEYKKGYTAYITKEAGDDKEFKICITNGQFFVKGLTKANSDDKDKIPASGKDISDCACTSTVNP